MKLEQLGYLIPGLAILGTVVGLLGWDLYQNIKHTPGKREDR